MADSNYRKKFDFYETLYLELFEVDESETDLRFKKFKINLIGRGKITKNIWTCMKLGTSRFLRLTNMNLTSDFQNSKE